MKTIRHGLIGLAGPIGLVLATASLPAIADTSIFSDKGTFLSASGATAASGAYMDVGRVPGDTLSVGSLTITLGAGASQLFSGTGGTSGAVNADWTTLLPGADLAIGGPENLDIALVAPVFSFGYDIVEPEFGPNINAPFVDSSFTVTLSLAGTTVASFSFNPANDTAAFIGIWSDSPFDRVSIVETTPLSGGENEFYGRFFTGTIALPPPPIPEPGTWAMLAGGLGLLALLRRRR